MNLISTNQKLTGAEDNAFVPLTETQMSSIRGGTDWPDWFVDLVGDIVTSLSDALEHIDSTLDAPSIDFHQEYWDEVESNLQSEGFTLPDLGGL